MKGPRRALAGVLVGLTTMIIGVAPAVAQQFEKVDDAARENLAATPFVAAAYGFIWLAILTFVVITARRIRRVEGEIANLRRRVDPSSGGGPR